MSAMLGAMLWATSSGRFAGWVGGFALAGLIGAVGASGGCSPNAVCKIAGPINDPSNYTLRRNIMSFGLGQFCQQMTAHNAPLKLSPDANVIGRFFPQHCTQQVLANGDLWVQFDGFGYAWTSLSKKVTFTSAATLQYNQDFKCAEDNSIYAYFDTRSASPPNFRLVQIEQPVANLVQNWISPFADIVRPADGRPVSSPRGSRSSRTRAGARTSASATFHWASDRRTPTRCTARTA